MAAINLYKQIVSHPDYFFCENSNSFNSKTYRSAHGNNYHIELRLVEDIITKAQVGKGYKHAFLNQLQFFNIKTKELLGTVEFHNQKYYQDFLIDQTILMLSKILLSNQSESDHTFSTKETIPQVFQIVNSAFETDQRTIAQNIILKQIAA